MLRRDVYSLKTRYVGKSTQHLNSPSAGTLCCVASQGCSNWNRQTVTFIGLILLEGHLRYFSRIRRQGPTLHVFRAEVAKQVAVIVKSRLHAVCRLQYNFNLLYCYYCILRLASYFCFSICILRSIFKLVYTSPWQLFESTCFGKNMYEIIVYNFYIYNLFLQ